MLALFLAAPAWAQSSQEAPPPAQQAVDSADRVATVDSALVGTWTLDEVTAAGTLDALGVRVEAMTCQFAADGHAEMVMKAVQDGEAIVRDRSFAFETADGQIIQQDGDSAVTYRILDDGSLELIDAEMVVRFVRAGP